MENLPNLNKPSASSLSASQSFAPDKVSYAILAFIAFLLPIFFIPSGLFTLGVSKAVLLNAGVIAAFFAFLLNVAKKGEFEFPKHKLLWGVLLVPVAFFLSAIFGPNPELSLFGYGAETGTWAFATLGFLFLFLTSLVFRNVKKVFYSYLALFVGVAVVALFVIAKLALGMDVLSFGIFNNAASNPIGTWTDLAVFLGASAVIIVIALESAPLSKLIRVVLILTLAATLFILAALNFSTAWLLLLIFSLVFFVYTASFHTVGSSGESGKRVSYSALALLIVSLVFYFNPSFSGAQKIGDVLAQKLSIAQIEVRPSLAATRGIIQAALRENLLFGSGPNTFESDWLKYKPAGVNESNFWNVSFPSGFGLLPTFVATTGLVGALAWLLFLGFYLQLGIKSIFADISDRLSRFLLTSSFLASLFLWIMVLVYVPSTAVLAFAFFFSGLFIALSVELGVIGTKVLAYGHSAKLSFIAVLALIGLLVGNVAFAYNSLSRAVSSAYFQKALRTAQESGDIPQVLANLRNAINLAGLDIYYRSLSQAHIAQVNQAINSADMSDTEKAKVFQNSLRDAITAAQSAIDANRMNYLNWMALGRIYESLVPPPINIEGSYDSAKSAYLEALNRNPHSPEIYLALARLEVVNGDNESARGYIKDSLAKKSNYADAYFLLTQIELAENNTQEAIQSAERAAILSPNNAGVFFQLGLLKYNAGDFQGAAEALAYAVNLVPDYANAKYFLGLSLDKLGQKGQALAYFEDLAETNPENEEVSAILENLRAGRDALYQISSGSQITNRTSPPITDSASSR